MALVNVHGVYLGKSIIGGSTANLLVDAAGEAVGFIFQWPKTGTVDRFIFRTGSVTTAQNMTLTFETVDSSGMPTGSAYGSSGATTWAPVDTDDNVNVELTLASSFAVTKGDLVVARFEWSGTAGNLNFVVATSDNVTDGLTRSLHDTGSGFAISNTCPRICLRYDDGTYVVPRWCIPPANHSSTIVDSASNPAEIGLYFISPINFSFDAIHYFQRDFGTTTTVTASVFSDAGGTPTLMTSKDFTHDQIQGVHPAVVCFPDEVTFVKGVHYAIVFKNLGTTSDYQVSFHDVPDVNHWGDYCFGTDYAWASRASAASGAFTKTATRKPIMRLHVTKLHDLDWGIMSRRGGLNLAL